MSTMPPHTPLKLSHLLLAIDPSITSLGYAWFGKHEHGGWVFLKAGHLKQHTPFQIDYHIRALMMVNELLQWPSFDDTRLAAPSLHLVIECPTNWFNAKGLASKDSEDIQKLYYFVGMVIGALDFSMREKDLSIWGVGPTQWKGQAPKKVMLDRFAKYMAIEGREYDAEAPHDTAEAVLLGRWAIDNAGPEMVFKEPMIPIRIAGVEWPMYKFEHKEYL